LAKGGGNRELNCVNPFLILNGGNSSTGNIFNYQWTTDTGNIISGENTLFPQVDLAGNYFLSVSNEENGCVSRDTIQVILNDKVPESAQFALKQPCFGEEFGTLTIENIQGGNPPYLFSFDDSTFTSLVNFPFLTIGNYNLKVRDEIGCEYDTTFQITELEELVLNLDSELEIKLGEEIILPALTNRNEDELPLIQWTPNRGLDCDSCLNPIANPQLSTEYFLTIEDENNCSATAKTILKINRESCVFIPNIFSPNGDGNNDTFFVNGIQNIAQIIQFQVFNRWGGLVFEQRNIQPNDPNVGWDGALNGRPVNSGVFPYSVEIEFIDGRTELFVGTVALVR
jgi:gliding motility-associated-like protein